MKHGLYVGDNNTYLDKFEQEYSNLSLIARGDGSEILIQNVKADTHFFIEPGESQDLMEFFYITDGEVLLTIDGQDKVLSKGEYFYVHQLKSAVKVKSITDVTLLYVTTKPVFHYISDQMKELIKIAKKSQEKDMYTHNHGDRVQKYSIEIADRLNLSDDEVEKIAFASLFHDIGKINVPDEILKKPSSLTKEEFECIKKHPEDGGKLVQNTYMKHIAEIIEQHHERIDGSGYPKGLKGEEICLEAKIICIADSYDAMTSDRPYRKGMTPQQALGEIKRLAGSHYDRELVDIFCDILYQKEGIK